MKISAVTSAKAIKPTTSPQLIRDETYRKNKTMTNNALLADGFSEALIGMGNRFTYDVAVYDYTKCIEILAREMPEDEAVEYFEFNVVGAYMGEHTPVFVTVGSTPQQEG